MVLTLISFTLGNSPLIASEEFDLAKHLSNIGAKFYGAWNCPACSKQKKLFGEEAVKKLPYVECTKPKEMPQQAKACIEANIRVFPTWLLPNGERLEGLQSIEELSYWSKIP